MTTHPKSRISTPWIWPVTGIVAAFFLALISRESGISLGTGLATWCVAMMLPLVLAGKLFGARIAAFIAGFVITVPCRLDAPPLIRFLLMCLMALSLCAATTLVLARPMPGFRTRLAYIFTWRGMRPAVRRPRAFDAASFFQLIIATAIVAAGVTSVKMVSGFSDEWMPVRWLAGGIAMLAFAEVMTAGVALAGAAAGFDVPPLMQSPYRATSLGEFWSRRWNLFATAMVFRPWCFVPLARRSAALALFATFAASAIAHTLIFEMALGRWKISLMCGAFFLVQPLLITVERWLHVPSWQPAAGSAWTLLALALVSPLFIEPMLQILEDSWGAPNEVLMPVLAALIFAIVVSCFFALVALAIGPVTAKRLEI